MLSFGNRSFPTAAEMPTSCLCDRVTGGAGSDSDSDVAFVDDNAPADERLGSYYVSGGRGRGKSSNNANLARSGSGALLS